MFDLYIKRCADRTWTRKGAKVLVGIYAPVSNNFGQLWERYKAMLPEIPGVAPGGGPQIKVYEKKDQLRVEIFGKLGIRIEFFSVHRKDSSRGNGYDILLGTEVAYSDEDDLTNNILKLVLRPDHAKIVMLNSTPRGPGEWWDKAIKQARLKKKGFWSEWELHEGCWVDNPKSDEKDFKVAEAEKAKNIYSYRRERLAWINVPLVPDSVMDGDGINRAFSPELIDSMLVSLPVEVTGPFSAGTDLGFTGADPMVTVVIDDPTGLVVDLKFTPTCNTQGEIVEHIEAVNSKWNITKHCFDANGRLASKIEGKLKRLRLIPVKTTTTLTGPDSKNEQVKHMEQHFLQGGIKIPNPEVYPGLTEEFKKNLWTLIIELHGYLMFEVSKDVVQGGKIDKRIFTTYGKPPKGTDDAVDALNMLCQGKKIRSNKAQKLDAAEVWA